MTPRYDPDRQVYRDCKWCDGRGCLGCKDEADKAYKREFPDGPKPIATFTTEEIQSGELRRLLGPEAIDSAVDEASKRGADILPLLKNFLIGASEDEARQAVVARLVPEILHERLVEYQSKKEGEESS